MNEQAKGALFVMAAGFLWGTVGIFSKVVYSETAVGPISLAWFRLIFAIPLLGFFTVIKRYEVSITLREVALFAGFGFCSLTVFEILFFTSFAYTSVQHAVALLYTAPAFVALLSWLILKEHLSFAKIGAVSMAIAGAFLIMGVARVEPLFASKSQIGDWLALGSGFAYSSWYIFGKVLGKHREPAVTSFLGLCFGAFLLLPFVILMEGFRLPQGLLAWGLVATVGIFPTALAYLLYLAGLKLIDATKASVFAITEPLTAAVLAFLFFREIFSTDSFLGFMLIISSIILISSRRP